jgi:hypothetical protein
MRIIGYVISDASGSPSESQSRRSLYGRSRKIRVYAHEGVARKYVSSGERVLPVWVKEEEEK